MKHMGKAIIDFWLTLVAINDIFANKPDYQFFLYTNCTK